MSPIKSSTTTPYGALLRQRRLEAKRSLREVANAIGISHVFLNDVERGVRGPLKAEHEPLLMRSVPTLQQDELSRARVLSRPIKITLEDTPPQYQDLTIAFARRIEHQDLSERQLAALLALLNDEKKDED